MSLTTFNERVTYARCVAAMPANDDANIQHNDIENSNARETCTEPRGDLVAHISSLHLQRFNFDCLQESPSPPRQ